MSNAICPFRASSALRPKPLFNKRFKAKVFIGSSSTKSILGCSHLIERICWNAIFKGMNDEDLGT